jgi:ACS family sodium-dependent inorganic phosphate cotransporter
MAVGFVTDYVIRTGKVSRAVARKAVTAIGCLGPAVALSALAFTGCNPTMAIFWLCIGVMLSGAGLVGFNVNVLELSPNYAGTLRGISSTFANMNGFFAPVIIGYITKNEVSIFSN